MINTLSLENFKSFKSTGIISLAPLTIFSGQNSSGKSSLIQTLLILKQSLESPVSGEPILLNGFYVSLGGFSDVLNYESTKKNIELSFSLTFPKKNIETTSIIPSSYSNGYYFRILRAIDELGLSINFGVSKSKKVDIPKLLSVLIKGRENNKNFSVMMKLNTNLETRLKTNFDIDDDQNTPDTGTLFESKKIIGSEIKPKAIVFKSFLPNEIFMPYHKHLIEAQNQFLIEFYKLIYAELNIKFPKYITGNRMWRSYLSNLRMKMEVNKNFSENEDTNQKIIKVFELLDRILINRSEIKDIDDRMILKKAFLGIESHDRLEQLLLSWISYIKTAEQKRKTLRLENVSEMNFELLDLEDINTLVTTSFDRLYYLGPLRDEPKAFYRRISSKDPMYVGPRGENLAFVLKYYSNKKILAILPPLSQQEEWDLPSTEPSMVTLGEALNRWLKYLGIANEVKIDEVGKVGLSIKANIYGQKSSSLTNVGVGVSQVLPLIVLGLLSPQDSILVLEQPELHLHPFVQSRLADFFVTLSRLRKQIIAETHSEHLILRTRYYIAKGNINVGDDVAIYFCTRDDTTSEIHKVDVDKFGSIVNWPSGFFDEKNKMLDNILLAALEREDLE